MADRSGMHAASIESSPRLQRVHDLLSDGEERSTLDIGLNASVCAVNSIVSELRAQGAEIECRQDRTASGSRIWLYRMTRPVEPQKRLPLGGSA